MMTYKTTLGGRQPQETDYSSRNTTEGLTRSAGYRERYAAAAATTRGGSCGGGRARSSGAAERIHARNRSSSG